MEAKQAAGLTDGEIFNLLGTNENSANALVYLAIARSVEAEVTRRLAAWRLDSFEPDEKAVRAGGDCINYFVLQAMVNEELHSDDLALRIWHAMRTALPPSAPAVPVGAPEGLTAELLADLKCQYGMVGTRDVDIAAWNSKLDRAIAALAAPRAVPVGAEPATCARCGGTGIVDDGEMECSEGGIPFENGPIKCVKDCPVCNRHASGPVGAEPGTSAKLYLTLGELRDALNFSDPGIDDEDSGETELVLQRLPARISTEGEPMGAGLYLWFSDLPEEGCIGPLGDAAAPEAPKDAP